jgi:hypothetical protein
MSKNNQLLALGVSACLAVSLPIRVYAGDTFPTPSPNSCSNIIQSFTDHHLIKDKLSVILEHNYYDWKNDQNGSGHQSITPITLAYRYDNFDFGWRRAYIESVNSSENRQGSVSTWSDTSLSAAYTFKEISWPLRINIDYNMPNGKAGLAGTEKNAIMDGSLVQQTRFGEGENIAIGMGITHAFGEKNIFGGGLSFLKRGQFNPNSDIANTELNPGDDTIATLQWQHNAKTWMLIGGVIYTQSGVTQRGGLEYYQKGDRSDINLTGIYTLTNTQRFQANLRYSTQTKDRYINSLGTLEQESANSNGNSAYLNLDWSNTWNGKHTLHISGDYLEITANSYDQVNDLYNAGRKKVGFGLGYDYAFNQKSHIAIIAKTYEMNDKATPATLQDTKYTGNNIYVNFSHSF